MLTGFSERVKIILALPPSSSGPGHSPLKAKTGVRVPVGAQLEPLNDVERFLSMLRFDSREKLDQLDINLGSFCVGTGEK